MAQSRIRLGRKRRTRAHVLADLSANHVEKQALLCGFSAERVRLDYGIDLIVQTFDRRGEVESSRILFQLKATDRIKTAARLEVATCRVERADLAHWLEEPFPVVLALYDAKADVAYWCYVQQHFGSLVGFRLESCGRSVTVSLSCSNILDKPAMKWLAAIKNAAAGRFQKVWTHEL
jgi:Domain of unknown function (DUF4365)